MTHSFYCSLLLVHYTREEIISSRVQTILTYRFYNLTYLKLYSLFYAFILYLTRDRVNFNTTDSWGYRGQNGSWSGMIGMLERREIDIGGTTTFFIPQRIGVVQYIQLYTRTK